MSHIRLQKLLRTGQVRVDGKRAKAGDRLAPGQTIRIPVAHHDGNYFADNETLKRLEGEGRVVFRYHGENPNGSAKSIAGITDKTGRILGLMPHPERASDPALGLTDGKAMFESILDAIT